MSRTTLIFLLVPATILVMAGLWTIDISYSAKTLTDQFPDLNIILGNGFYALSSLQGYHMGLWLVLGGFTMSALIAFLALEHRRR